MTIEMLCGAAIEYSDNTAANLLLNVLGGPSSVTKYARSLGDSVTRLDRTEPSLNTALPGDLRDTTTPAAMLGSMKAVLGGKALSPASRSRLEDWLFGNTTGAARLRAGLPAPWRVGDKTGTGENGATNDIAIAIPSDSPPILIAAYFVGSRAHAEERDAALSQVGKIVAKGFSLA